MVAVLFKNLQNESVHGLTSAQIRADLQLLSHLETGKPVSSFSADDMAHFRRVTDAHLQDHPLGFLARNNPMIAQSLLQDALRKDVAKLLMAYTLANGHSKDLDVPLSDLRYKGSAEFAPAVQAAFTTIHRDILMKTAKDMNGMARAIADDLWGTNARDEHAMATQFKQATRQLDTALSLFDQGQTDAAMALYAEVMGDSGGYADWFGRAQRESEHYKFAAHVGIAMAAGAAAYFTGGASLALMGGQEAAFGAHVTSMLIGGAGMTVTSRGLNAAVFNQIFLSTGTPFEQTVDFGGDVLRNTALMGVLKLGGIAGASLPVMDGEPVIAASINAARNFAIEFGSLTGFNMISSVSNVIDDRYPSIDDTLSKDALLQNAAFILGLRAGHLGLNAAKLSAKHTASPLLQRSPFAPPELAPFPLLLASRVAPFLGALYLMDGKVPPAILSTQLLGLRPITPRTTALIQVMGGIGKSLPMRALRFLVNQMDTKSLFDNTRIARMDSASDFVRLTLFHLQDAVAAQQAVGLEIEFDPRTATRDQTHMMMAKALEGAGYTVQIQNGAGQFRFQSPIKVAPIIVGQGSVNGQAVRTEVFQNNGTTLVSVVRDADTARTHVLVADHAISLAGADAILKSTLDAPPQESFLIIAKDDTGDTFKMAVELIGHTHARLTGMNGKFLMDNGKAEETIEIRLEMSGKPINGSQRPQLDAVLAHVKASLGTSLTVQKTNHITGLYVPGLGNGNFQVVDEVPPFLEAITAKMNVGDVKQVKPMVAAFRRNGFDGTRSAKMVGMHVHAEVTRTVAGQHSIAPALNLLRAFALCDHMIYDLFPSHENRGGFIQRMPEAYRSLLNDPYYVTDPTDPSQIAKVIADYNKHMPVKYSDINMDNYFAVMVKDMGLDPALARTAPNKPTAELRLFDAIMDPDSVVFMAQFWGTFVHKYANRIAE